MRWTVGGLLGVGLALLPWGGGLWAQDVGGSLPAGCAAEAVRCEEGPLHRWRAVDEPFGSGASGGLDTGWQPAGSPVQVRFVVRLAGRTEVELEGRPRASWPEALSVGVEGTAGSGRLRLDHGLTLQARLRFDLEVGGVRYRWEGDLPLGGVPSDLAVRDEAAFDSMAFAPADGAEASDATGRVPIARYDALGGLVDVPGVGGGVALTGELRLTARYRTRVIEVSAAPAGPRITEEGGLAVRRPAEPFGARFEVPVTPVGQLDYDGQVVLVPTVYLSFPGGVRRDFDLGEIPVPWRATREVRFDTLPWTVALPDLAPPVARLDFGAVAVSGRRELLLSLRNRGEAPLSVFLAPPGDGPFSLGASAAVTLPPRSAARLPVVFEPAAGGAASGELRVRSDDPDDEMFVVQLVGEGLALPEPMPEPTPEPLPEAGPEGGAAAASSAGGCGCRTVGTAASAGDGLPLVVLLGGLLARRRGRAGRGGRSKRHRNDTAERWKGRPAGTRLAARRARRAR